MSLKYRVKLIKPVYVGTPVGKEVDAVQDKHGDFLVKGSDLGKRYFCHKTNYIFLKHEVQVMEVATDEEI